VGLAQNHYYLYPHQLSGGMRQRVVIAMAMCHHPSVLIADEPTSMLDQSLQRDILDTLETVRKKKQMGLLFITHNIAQEVKNPFTARRIAIDLQEGVDKLKQFPKIGLPVLKAPDPE
jgi:ABC-type dipeptide/oligopeptide/nickel transport system ATPase component